MATTEDQLRSFLQDIAKKENYAVSKIDIKPITSGGANYTTDLFLATISEAPKQNLNIFAKAANLSEEARKANEFLSHVYETEVTFYTEIVANFQRIYDKHRVPVDDRLIVPKYYGHVLIPYQEILVLENLEARGFKNFDRMKTFDWDYAFAAVTQMARFHSLGLALRDENPEEFQKLINSFNVDFNKYQEIMNIFMKMALENGSEGLDGNHKERLLNYFSSQEQQMEMMAKMMQDQTMLIHGDFRPSNLMHRRRNGKLEVMPLDYQTLRLGSPMMELLYFIFSGSDEEFRRLHFQHLLEHYYSQLTLALRQVNVDVQNVYPRKTFDNDSIEMRPIGLFFGLIMAAMVTVAPEDAPTLTGDFSSMQVKPNQLAQERIRGIVNDYVRWGVL